MYSPYAPLTKSRSSQRLGRPRVHEGQRPHGAELAATTRSPSRNRVRPAPTALTVPANSWPNTVGTRGIITGWPRRSVLTSVPQVRAASTRMTSPPGSGDGIGISSKRRSPGPWNTIALMVGARRPSRGDGIAGPQPASESHRELPARRQGDPLSQHAKAPPLDLLEQGEVDPAHDLGRDQRAGIGRGIAGPCGAVKA